MSVGHALDCSQTEPLAEMESTAHDVFVRLLEQYRASLRRLAWSYTRNSAQRDDLFQEIALAIWRAHPGFRGECSERTFVFRIAHNRGLSFLARHADSPEVIDDVDAWQARDVNHKVGLPHGRMWNICAKPSASYP